MSPDAEDASPSPEPGQDQDSTNMGIDKHERASTDEKSSPGQTGNDSGSATKPNPKDPSRPRRKKARRACFACQRAHLTCGDERPCNRCIKRGLQDQCHDGVRKKAKYLHDAPNEALLPGFQGNYHVNGNHGVTTVQRASPSGQHNLNNSQSTTYFSNNTTSGFPQYGPANQQGNMGPPMLDTGSIVNDFANHQNADTPHRYSSASARQLTPRQEIGNSLDQANLVGSSGNQTYDQSYLDPSDPNYYNFNLNVADLNFGNHYGALEFGMLGHIASGAADASEIDPLNTLGHSNRIGFERSPSFPGAFGYNHVYQGGWQNVPTLGSRQNSSANIWASNSNAHDAFAIGEHPPSLTASSPKSQNQDFPGYQSTSPETSAQPEHSQQQELLRLSHQQSRKPAFPGDPITDPTRKRKRETASIYLAVKKPYSYTAGFHALTAYLTTRFSRERVLAIAKALATVRPSFIACNKNLTNDDLIFTEQAFQRAICEYKEIISNTSTPTIVCRRTGEIAVVSKEFTLMTDWRKEVLLGHERNLNINTGNGTPEIENGSTARGAATPRPAPVEIDAGRPQPVFLAELMDEDSVVDFYENFAEIAFGASRSSVVGEHCTLLKYRTKEDAAMGAGEHVGDDSLHRRQSVNGKDSHIKGESGMKSLGGREGRIECSMCWTVKRDTFDMPLLIVINFLPITGL